MADPGGEVLIERGFVRDEITDLRHAVAECSRAAGLDGDRLAGFVLAVNEVITNVVLHGGGRGRLRLRTAPGALLCEVTDRGPGIPERYLGGEALPPASAVGGRGIWLAYHLCDSVTVKSGSSGSTVTLSVGLPGPASRADRPERAIAPPS